MRIKKRIDIDTFNNFSNYSKPINESFFNYKSNTKLEVSNGIDTPHFPYSESYSKEYTLQFDTAEFQKVEGLTSFKQYYPDSGITTHRLLIYGDDKKVYFNQLLNNSGQVFWLYQLTFNSPPSVLTYKKNDVDIVILADKEKMVFWELNQVPYEVGNLPIITSICMNDNYAYCTLEDPAYKLWYTKSSEVQNVGTTGIYSGYISLDDDLGDARKVIVFDKEVYIFRDYGISKLTQIKGEIQVNNVYASNSLIHANTVSVSGNEVFFMTNEGLYSFNGYKVEKTGMNFNHFKMSGLNSAACCLGDKYYLALRLDFEDEKQVLCETAECINNALVIIDVNDYSYQLIRGVDIKSFLPLKTKVFEKVLVVFNTGSNGIGEIVNNSVFFDVALPKYWRSGDLCSTSESKLFTKLTVNADKDVKITLVYDDKTISFTTYTTGMNEFVFKICAKQIKVEISSVEAKANVKNVSLDYYVY